jgi:hypothetical protein
VKEYRFTVPAANNVGWVGLGILEAADHNQAFQFSLLVGAVFTGNSQGVLNVEYQFKPGTTTLTSIGTNSWKDVISMDSGIVATDTGIFVVRTKTRACEIWFKQYATTAPQMDLRLEISSSRPFAFSPDPSPARQADAPDDVLGFLTRPNATHVSCYNATDNSYFGVFKTALK